MSDDDQASTVSDVKTQRKEQLAEARRKKEELKKKREVQLDQIQEKLEALTKKKTKKKKRQEEEEEEAEDDDTEEEDEDERPPAKKIKVTRDTEEDESEGWGTTIFRCLTPILVAAIPVVVTAVSSSLQRNVPNLQPVPAQPRPQVHVPPTQQKASVQAAVSRMQKSYPTPATPQQQAVKQPKPIGQSGFSF